MVENYYLKNKNNIMCKSEKDFLFLQKEFCLSFPELADEAPRIFGNAKKDFQALLADLPDIGGKKNAMVWSLIQGGICTVIIKILKKKGLETRAIGKYFYDAFFHFYDNFPGFVKAVYNTIYYSKLGQFIFKKVAHWTQKREYPHNWVIEFIPGDGKEYKFKTKVTECAMVKLYKAQRIEDVAPYMCLIDWAMWKALGQNNNRFSTLSAGADCCDFYWGCSEKNEMTGWPPDNLEEWPGK